MHVDSTIAKILKVHSLLNLSSNLLYFNMSDTIYLPAAGQSPILVKELPVYADFDLGTVVSPKPWLF